MSILTFAKKLAGQTEKPKAKPAKTKARQAPPADAGKKAVQSENIAAAVSSSLELIPLISEKSVTLHASTNTVAFRVAPRASKGAIGRAIQQRYGFVPVHVRTTNQVPKVRRRGRTQGRTRAWKKAYVTLPEGKSIDFSV